MNNSVFEAIACFWQCRDRAELFRFGKLFNRPTPKKQRTKIEENWRSWEKFRNLWPDRFVKMYILHKLYIICQSGQSPLSTDVSRWTIGGRSGVGTVLHHMVACVGVRILHHYSVRPGVWSSAERPVSISRPFSISFFCRKISKNEFLKPHPWFSKTMIFPV